MDRVDSQVVREEAKQIMDKFMNLMKDIDVEEDFVLKRENCTRVESQGLEADPDFVRRFLKNAPKTSGNAVLANKGAWEE